MGRTRNGLTLIEIMLIVLVLAIVAAIAIPALLRSRLKSSETSFMSDLKQIVSTETTWRQVDADGNGMEDYWTLDVAGFYGMQDPSGAVMKLIAVNLANADASRRVSYSGKPSPNSTPCRPLPKAGYVFRSIICDDGAGKPTAYSINYVPTQKNSTVLRNSKDAYGYATAGNSLEFAFCATPAQYNVSGIRTFIVNEEGVIYGADRGSNLFVATWPGTDPTAKQANGRSWAVVQ